MSRAVEIRALDPAGRQLAKIATLDSLEEIDGYRRAALATRDLTPEERAALTRRAGELTRGS